MTRFLSKACIPALLLGIFVLVPASAIATVPAPVFLTASGMFKSFELTEDGMLITLSVNGEEFWGILNPTCLFYDAKGNAISRDDFFGKYLERVITVELEESSGGIFACYPDTLNRAETARPNMERPGKQAIMGSEEKKSFSRGRCG